MSDDDFDKDPNAPSERQLLVKSIEQMIRKTGDVFRLMELDEICNIKDEKACFQALLKLKNTVLSQ